MQPWETRRRSLRVAFSIIKVEGFRRWRDGSAAERRAVKGESLTQSLELGFGGHGLVLPLLRKSQVIYMRMSAWRQTS